MKKHWISLKCGLSRDPKHRRKMGKSVWTFIHILDLADWETGIVYDWKDENAAEDMGVDLRVLREDRRKLEQEGYIVCRQKQYGQDITIMNWTNPREYSGEVYNQKQDYRKYPPSKTDQGYIQGDTQGSIKDVTPTLDSNIKESINVNDEASRRLEILCKLYSGTIGLIHDVITADILKEAANEFTDSTWYEPAFRIAVENNIRKWSYVYQVLKNWKEKGRGWSPIAERHNGRSKGKTPTPSSAPTVEYDYDALRKLALEHGEA